MAVGSSERIHADHQVPTGKNTIDSSSDEYSDGISDDEVRNRSNSVKIPLRNARRKSVMPSPSLKLNDSDVERDQSPHNSVTSINSLSSLLKEKLVMTFPGVLRKKRPREYKLRGFVAVLFLCIVFLVGFAYIFYHQQVLQRAYFDRIRFNKEERHVRVFNEQGQEILQGWLGTFLKDVPHFGYHETNIAYPCLPRDAPTDGSLCLEWMHKARLYMRYHAIPPGDGGEMRCYQIEWLSLSEEVNPTDCFDWSNGRGHWYGGGKTPGMAWPMELGGNLKEVPNEGTIEIVENKDETEDGMAPFVTGDASGGLHSWGNVLNRYFINSRGVALSVDANTPFYSSLEKGPIGGGRVGKRFCLQARYDDFAFSHRTTPLPRLSYSICTASNVKTLHSVLSEKSLWDGLKKEDLDVINTMLNEPVWRLSDGPGTKQLTEQALVERAEGVVALGFLRQGHVVLGEGWQRHPGDFTLDQARFPTMRDTINILHRRGFRIALTISPFVSTESESFQVAVKNGLLVAEQRGGTWHQNRNVPALTRYGNTASAGVLDVTNTNHTVPWLREKLRAIVNAYAIDAFYLDVGTAFDMPRFPRLEYPRPNLDSFKTAFMEAVLGGASVLGMSGAVQRPRPPAFVSLPAAPSSWESLRAIIPTTLTYGVIGYPFVMPGPVGGDYDPNFTEEEEGSSQDVKTTELPLETTTPTTVIVSSGDEYNETEISSSVSPSDVTPDEVSSVADSPASPVSSTSTTSLPQSTMSTTASPSTTASSRSPTLPPPPRELYLRWLQLATFLPVIQHRLLPSQYEDAELLEVARELASIRQKVVSPLLRRYAREALDSGLPLVRPLWMLDPTDVSCQLVSDEFSVGDELIVAPVLREGSREREVYLPAGVWKDGIDGSLRKGDRWIHNYRVNEDKVAYFVKMPDNTRL